MIKRTFERKIVSGSLTRRLAMTLTLDVNELPVPEGDVQATLAQAVDSIQRVLFPPETERERPHPRESALFERLEDGHLVRIRCQPADLERIASSYRYLVGAYDGDGRLLPTFWHLPLIDIAHLLVQPDPQPCPKCKQPTYGFACPCSIEDDGTHW